MAERALTLAGWEAERSGADRLPVGRAVEATGGAGGRGDGWSGRFRLRAGGAGVAGVVVAADAAAVLGAAGTLNFVEVLGPEYAAAAAGADDVHAEGVAEAVGVVEGDGIDEGVQ